MKRNDSIAVIPTDTIYGLVGSALSKRAVSRIYKAKGRNTGKACIVLISKLGDLELFGVKLTQAQKQFLREVWPGSVSVILPVPSKRFEYLHRGLKSIAFRLPKGSNERSFDLQDFLKKNGPMIAPSANPEGLTPATTLAEAQDYFGDSVDSYLLTQKKPRAKQGSASTLVTFEHDKVIVLRQGSAKIPKRFLAK